jgi:molybdopterin molybdotransferase
MQTGEDLTKGDVAVDCGVRLRPQHLGLIAALGVAKLAVFEKPQISILATGNELVETSCRPQRDQVFEVNRHLISGLCIELGVEPIDLGIVGDDCKKIERKLVEGLGSDGVITTGGTSTGILDLVPDVVNKIGRPGVIVHGVAMRPGMPTALAVVNAKPVLILSGNPVAAVFAFEVFARPLFSGMLGLREVEYRPTLKAKMTKKVATTLGRKTFVRVYAFLQEGEFSAEPISTRGSGVISTITRSNGYVVVPEDREGLNKGETVLVHVYGNVRGVDPSV